MSTDIGAASERRSINEVLAAARARLNRIEPTELESELARGAIIVDTRPVEQRQRDGELPGALVINRNVLEWRLDPASEHHIPEVTDHRVRIVIVCNEGFQSSLTAAALQDLGLHRATDLIGGFQGWLALRQPSERRSINEVLAAARARLNRIEPSELEGELASGAIIVDTRPVEQRQRDGELPGALVIDRNILEWRLDPASEHHIPEVTDHGVRIVIVCSEGYNSSLAAAALQDLGLHRATDLIGGFQGLMALRQLEIPKS